LGLRWLAFTSEPNAPLARGTVQKGADAGDQFGQDDADFCVQVSAVDGHRRHHQSRLKFLEPLTIERERRRGMAYASKPRAKTPETTNGGVQALPRPKKIPHP
jgi:hypothetical protein